MAKFLLWILVIAAVTAVAQAQGLTKDEVCKIGNL